MLFLRNEAIKKNYYVSCDEDRVFFESKKTEEKFTLQKTTLLISILSSSFFPNSIKLIHDWKTRGRVSLSSIARHFNYRGLKLSNSVDTDFTFLKKKNILFDIRGSFIDTIHSGIFNRGYFDFLIDYVLPLLADEPDSFSLFSSLVCSSQVSLSLKKQDNKLYVGPTSIFTSVSFCTLKSDLASLKGKILFHNDYVELLDPNVEGLSITEQDTGNLKIATLFYPTVSLENLTPPVPLLYNDDVLNSWLFNG